MRKIDEEKAKEKLGDGYEEAAGQGIMAGINEELEIEYVKE